MPTDINLVTLVPKTRQRDLPLVQGPYRRCALPAARRTLLLRLSVEEPAPG